MTRFTVVWYPFPESELLRLWLSASDKQAVTNAANTLDRQLATDPYSVGCLALDQLRELTVRPLRVLYSVSEPDRIVKVLTVEQI